MTMMRAARAASASALGRSAWEVDVRAELTADGRVESIVGVDVRWRLSSGPELSAAQLGAWLVAEHGAALGLLAGADVLLPIGTVEWGKGKAQRFQRLRQGTVVAGDAIVALWQQGRVLRGLRAAVTPLPIEESGELDLLHGDGVGGALVYAVNWDGVRRLNATRCVLGDATCDGMAIRIEDLAWVDADYPAGPPVAVDTASDETFLLYPNHHGELIAQRVAQGSFEAPFGTGAVAPQTLRPGFAVAALANPASGPGLQGDTVIAYVCDLPGCDCGGLRPPNTNVICSQSLDGAWHQVLATLAPTEVACSALGVPSGLPPLSTAAPLHQPTLVRSGQHAVLLWVDRHQGAGDYRVLSRVGQPGPGAWQWGAVQPWTTLGAADGSDLGSFTARPIAAAAMPGAGGFSTLAEDNADRVAVMFQPVRYPDIDPATGQATCGAVARMYAFASAAVDPANLSLAAFSRSVAQNDGSTALFGAADTYTVPISDDHHAAGGFLAAGDRTYAWLRRATRPCLPPDPPVCVENGPDYAIAPVASYGQLLVKSTGWR